MSNPRYGSGKYRFIGQGIEVDLSKLDPAAYEGTAVYSQQELYFSNGSDWVIPQDEVDIARPRGLDPTTTEEQAQLRLSALVSPTGQTQTGVVYQFNLDGEPNFSDGANFATRSFLDDTVRSIYDVVYPDDGFAPGDIIWWRARYLGTSSTQSQYSIPIAQFFPDLITTPTPLTPQDAISGVVRLTEFDSAAIFGLSYYETQIEFYELGDTPGVDAPITTVTVQAGDPVTGATVQIPLPPLVAGETYIWRGRYGGRVSVGSSVVYSNWSGANPTAPAVFVGAAAIILTYDIDLLASRTAYLPINTLNNALKPLNVNIEWGDGVNETVTTAGIKSHTYNAAFTPTDGIVTVTISGKMDWYGTTSAIDQSGLTRVENIGFQMGLESMRGAFRGTKSHLVFITPDIPDTVTSFQELFHSSSCAANLSALDTSNITDIRGLFTASIGSGPNCSGWDVSSVTQVEFIITDNSQFNNIFTLGNWSSLTSTYQMFHVNQTAAFNQPIGYWDMSNVTDMSQMFDKAYSTLGSRSPFDQDIGAWDVSNVTNMSGMFATLRNESSIGTLFNNGGSDSIKNWDVSNVTNMSQMFENAKAFNQPIGAWNVSSVVDMQRMFSNSVFNQPLTNWERVGSTVGNVTNMFKMFRNATAFNSSLADWNVSSVTNMSGMFRGATAFNSSLANWERVGSTVGNVTDMSFMFFTCAFNQPIGNWDVSGVQTFEGMFACGLTNARSNFFDQNLSDWDVSGATNMTRMFGGLGRGGGQVQPFNNGGSPGINNWDVSNVTNMFAMFGRGQNEGILSEFNQPIGGWDVSNVTDMRSMFDARASTHAFNQDISQWNLNPNVQLDNFMRDYQAGGTRAFSQENYSRLLTGWSNRVNSNNGPLSANTFFYERVYNNTAYQPSSRFTNAVTGRAFLVGTLSLSVASASNALADGTYLFNAASGLYVNTNNWYFIKSGSTWTLSDNTDTAQATGDGANPWNVNTWTGVLSAATVLNNGAGWTITGDSAA